VHLLRAIDSDADLGAASIYLAGVARRLAASGLFAVPDVVIEPAAAAICRAARDADLVIMATHGRGGLDRMRYGSVAEHVLQRVTTPLLLVRARRSRLLAALRAGAAPVAV
jgi:nucleotide-binding universal stress UspA family protein